MEIGVWGDSITYGESDSEGLGWVGRIRKKLFDSANVYNCGICGDTSIDLCTRFLVEAHALEPTHIIFAIGINDSKFLSGSTRNNVPIEKFEENMRQLTSQAREITKQLYVIGLTRVSENRISPSGSTFLNAEIKKYDNFLEKFAQSENLSYISTADVLDPEEDLADGLHPNAKGYQKLYEVISSNLFL